MDFHNRHHKHPSLTQGVKEIHNWKPCAGLVEEMEFKMKSLGLIPSTDNPKNLQYLKLEWQFFWDRCKEICFPRIFINSTSVLC